MNNLKPMTRSRDEQPSQRIRLESWSARVLGSSDGVDQSRELELLERLGAEGFLPTASEDAALRVIWNGDAEQVDPRTRATIRAEKHRQVTRWIEEFERQFFGLPADQRRRRWIELIDHCDDLPLLRLRLQRLEGGLDAQLGVSHPELVAAGSIGDYFQRLFLADRSSVPLVFAAFDDRVLSKSSETVQSLARDLKQHHSKIAALQPELLEELLERQARNARRSQARARRAKSISGRDETSAGSMMWMAIVAGIVLVTLIIGNANKSHRRATNSTNRYPNAGRSSPTDEDLFWSSVSPGEQAVEVAERSAREDPESLGAQHLLGKILIKSALASYGTVNNVASLRMHKDDERESYYLRACKVLQSLMVSDPDNVQYAGTFFDACQRYTEHPRFLRTISDKFPTAGTMPTLRHSYFRQLANTHRQRNRYLETIETLLAHRELSQGEPKVLWDIAKQFAALAWSPDSEGDRPEAEVVNAATREFLNTMISLWNESVLHFRVTEDDA